MKLFLRLLWLILTQRFRPRCNILDRIETSLRVYPNDLDTFLHVNNGVYLTYADLGRTDLLLRCNAIATLRKKGWYPVAAGASLEYKSSLKLGQKFTISTRVAAWDSKAVYLEQLIIRSDKVVARILIDSRFLSRSGERIGTAALLNLLGIDQQSPPMSQALQLWIDSRKLHRKSNASPTSG